MNDTTGFIFEWDDEKAKANIKKHHVSFHEGVTVFNDPDMDTLDDPDHSNDEDRYIGIGYSLQENLLVISYTYNELRGQIRLIICRKASKRERKIYEEEY